MLSTVDGKLLLFPVRHYLLLNTQYEGQWTEVVIIIAIIVVVQNREQAYTKHAYTYA